MIPETLQNKVYCTYLVLDGDASATALACKVDQSDVETLAKEQGWEARLTVTSKLLEKSSSPAEVERLLNRAASFIQAMRIRRLVDKLIAEFEEKAAANCVSSVLMRYDKDGHAYYDLRPLEQLCKSAQVLADTAASALCDTDGERKERLANNPSLDQQTLTTGKQVLDALNQMSDSAESSDVESVKLLKENL